MSRTDGTNNPIPFPQRALLKPVPSTHPTPQTRQPLTDFSPEVAAAAAGKPASGVAASRGRLTGRQQQILDFISESLRRRGYPPTLREIGERMAIRSTNGVNDHLKALEKKGYLQ